MKEKILIVEDQFIEANNLQEMLEAVGYFVLGIARSVPKAIEILDNDTPDLVLLDIFLQGPLTGIDLAKTLRLKNIPFVYLSANSDRKTLEAAKATYPYGFLVKPFRQKDVMVMMEIARYLHQHNLESINLKKSGPRDNTDSNSFAEKKNFSGIIGDSLQLKNILNHVRLVAPSDTSVLILGESGTGKEMIANTVHDLSARKSKPFIKINCAALPATLVESILFGHEKGAFTGATEMRIGKFEQAQGGTIFLDEIGELPLEVQVKLLRVLQEKEIERLGGSKTIQVDVRVIAATNRNLIDELAKGKFRLDLYYRLNVFPLSLPPLRERKEDIPLLACHFVSHYSEVFKKNITRISDPVLTLLTNHDWPGNIRELEHTIERAVLMTFGDVITEIARPETIKNQPTEAPIRTLEEMERDHILSALKQCDGKISGDDGAAKLLGLNASTLNSRMKKLGIQKEFPKFN